MIFFCPNCNKKTYEITNETKALVTFTCSSCNHSKTVDNVWGRNFSKALKSTEETPERFHVSLKTHIGNKKFAQPLKFNDFTGFVTEEQFLECKRILGLKGVDS